MLPNDVKYYARILYTWAGFGPHHYNYEFKLRGFLGIHHIWF